MKQLGRFCAVVILALSLSLSTYAGHIPCPGITGEPTATEATTTGETTTAPDSTDPVTELVISLLNLLSLV